MGDNDKDVMIAALEGAIARWKQAPNMPGSAELIAQAEAEIKKLRDSSVAK